MPEAAIAAAEADAVLPIEDIPAFLYGLCVGMSDRAKLLLVDDRPENLLALEAILEPLGPELVRAGSGEEALRHLLQDEFAAILLDVQMPGLDGFQTAELIKERERTRTVPILFLTAISKDAEHVFRGYDVGAVDYLMKPFDPADPAGEGRGLHRPLAEDGRAATPGRGALGPGARDARAGERARLPVARRRSAADRLDDRPGRDDDVLQRALVRVHGRGGGERRRRRPRRFIPRTSPERSRSGRNRGRPARSSRRSTGCAAPTASGAGTSRGRFRCATRAARSPAGSEPRRTSRIAASPRSGSASSPRRPGCSEARSTTSATSRRSPASPSGGSPTSASSTCSRTLSSEAPRGRARRSGEGAACTRAAAGVPAGRGCGRRTGIPELVAEIERRGLSRASTSLSASSSGSSGCARTSASPLLARDHVLGAITLAQAESGRIDGIAQLELARQLASRAAIAIDNAQLYEEAERRAQAARVLAAVGDAVFLVDREGIVRLWNTAAETITGLSAEAVVGRRVDQVIPGWVQLAPLIPVASGPGELVRRRDRSARARRPRAVDLGVGRRLRRRDDLRVPRPDRGARARGAEGRVRGDRLPRAAHAARGDLRLGADDQAVGHRARPGGPRPAARRDRDGVRPARRDRQRPARRRAARRGRAAGLDRALRPGRARRLRPRHRPGAPPRGDRPRAARGVRGPSRGRRPGPAAAGARQPRRQRDQVLARGRPRRGLDRRRRAARSASRSPTTASGFRPPSTAGSSRSSTASTRA